MKIYNVHLDDYALECVLTALMEKAQACKGQARENYMQVYGDIKEEILNQ